MFYSQLFSLFTHFTTNLYHAYKYSSNPSVYITTMKNKNEEEVIL